MIEKMLCQQGKELCKEPCDHHRDYSTEYKAEQVWFLASYDPIYHQEECPLSEKMAILDDDLSECICEDSDE